MGNNSYDLPFYLREAYLHIGIPGQIGKIYKPDTAGNLEETIRFYFEIEKTRTSEPNICRLQVWNFSQDTINELKNDGYHIAIYAGYIGNARLLFVGDITKSNTKWEGQDSITSIEAEDGHVSYTYSDIYASYSAGISYKQLYQELAASMNLPVGYLDPDINYISNNGVTFAGLSRKYLNNLTSSTDHEFSIQNETFQLVKKNSYNNQAVVVIDPDSGLIGSPENVEDEVRFNKDTDKLGLPKYMRAKTIRIHKNKKPRKKSPVTVIKRKAHGLRVTCLLNPDIIPAGRVHVTSQATGIDGTFIVEKCQFKGDTMDNIWQTELVCS